MLFVIGSNDDRGSTEALRRVAATLTEHHGVRVSVLLLRRSDSDLGEWRGARVIDDLRRWLPAVLLDWLISPTVGARMRGARLRWWLLRARPDVVVLDDGLGLRVLDPLRRRPRLVVRLNHVVSPSVHLERPVPVDPDLVIAPVDMDVGTGPAVLREPPLASTGGAERFGRPAERAALRRKLDIPEEAVVVGGWGTDGWLDGPDLFVRHLWVLEHRLGVEAHGLWFGSGRPEEVRRLTEEAERCGVSSRYHLLAYDGTARSPVEVCCADAIFLPTRAPLLLEHLVPAFVAGLEVVTFRAAALRWQSVTTVDDLDVERAAVAVVAAVDGDREERARNAAAAVDMEAWVRQLLDAASSFGG